MKSILICFLLSFVNNVSGQTSTNFEIEYQVKFNDAFDRGRKDRLHRGFLLVNDPRSCFYMREEEKYKPDNENDLVFTPDTNMRVYTDRTANLLIAQEHKFDGRPFFMTDSLFPMQWSISNETRQIDSLACIKANCRFRGRNYEAWFSPDIPLPFGPWKMGGLPGLIIELKDDQDNLLFRLTKITTSKQRVDIPTGITFSYNDHVAALKDMLKKLQGSARTAGSGDCINCQTMSKVEINLWEKISE